MTARCLIVIAVGLLAGCGEVSVVSLGSLTNAANDAAADGGAITEDGAPQSPLDAGADGAIDGGEIEAGEHDDEPDDTDGTDTAAHEAAEKLAEMDAAVDP